MADKCFMDSNVVLYLISGDAAKANVVEALLLRKPVVSVQVLNEVANVCVRKLRLAWDDTHALLGLIRGVCKVTPVTVDVHDAACRLAQRYRLSFYDAGIVAAAHLAGCRVLYTEDMHRSLTVEGGLLLCNPFGDCS